MIGGGRYGMPIGRIAAASIGFEQRRVVATYDTYVRESLGFGADVGATLGLPFARLSARGGMLRHGGTTDEGYGSVGAIAWWRAWRASAEVRRELAYPHLMTARVLATRGEIEPGEAVDASVMATRQIYGVAGAIGIVDIGIVADVMRAERRQLAPRHHHDRAVSARRRAVGAVRRERRALSSAERLLLGSAALRRAFVRSRNGSRRRDRGLSYVARDADRRRAQRAART